MKQLFLSVVVLLVVTTGALAGPMAFYVSATENDTHPGTQAQPFKTIERARDAVRASNATMTEDITVFLGGGRYVLTKPIVLEPPDSGTGGHRVIYRNVPGDAPILSGGQRITGWTRDVGNRWKAPVTIPNFRQLHVNGQRAVRAAGPVPQGIRLHGKEGYRIDDGSWAKWQNPSDIEFCYRVVWTHSRCPVQSIRTDGAGAIITMRQPCFTYARNKEGVQVSLPSYVQNALELLDEPGEWYLDRKAGMVYYMPREKEDMATAEVVAPALDQILLLNGTLDKPVHDVQFIGLTFADADFLRPSEIGHADVQANFLLDPLHLLERDGKTTAIHNEHLKSPSAVVCRASHSIRFDACTFTRMGGGALDIEVGSSDNTMDGCEFFDVGGSAIQVGDVLKDDHHPDDPRRIVKNNAVTNCYIHDVAVSYNGGVGVFVGYTDGTVIAHNEICRLPYSGVSIGWGWGEEDAGGGAANYTQPFRYKTPTAARNNRCEFNHVHHVMQAMQDGGAIYTLSIQPGTILRGNHLHDNKGGPGGIYLDEGSGNINVTGNLIYRVPRPLNFNNSAQDRRATCEVHDNVAEEAAAAQWSADKPDSLPENARKIAAEAGPGSEYRARFDRKAK